MGDGWETFCYTEVRVRMECEKVSRCYAVSFGA